RGRGATLRPRRVRRTPGRRGGGAGPGSRRPRRRVRRRDGRGRRPAHRAVHRPRRRVGRLPPRAARPVDLRGDRMSTDPSTGPIWISEADVVAAVDLDDARRAVREAFTHDGAIALEKTAVTYPAGGAAATLH